MKLYKIFLIAILIMAFYGCSNKNRSEETEAGLLPANQTRFSVEIVEENGFEVPKILASSTEGTYLSYLNSLDGKEFSNSAELVEDAIRTLYGKYEEMGSIELLKDEHPYSLLYIKTDGRYYPLDVYAQYLNKAKWLEGFDGDEFVFSRLSDTREAVRKGYSVDAQTDARAVYAKAVTGEVFDIDYETYGIPMYMYDEFQVPLGLGLPKLSREEALSVEETDEADRINTYPDLLMYLRDRTDYADPSVPNLTHSYILLGDYDTVKILKVKMSEGVMPVIIIGNGEKYYVVDLFEKAMAAKNMKHFYDVCGLKEFDSLEEVEETFSKEFPWGGAVQWAKIEEVEVPYMIKAPNGQYLSVEKRLGHDVFVYFNVQIPLGLGLPKLTLEEIDELLVEKDAEKIRDRISTLADAVCYISEANYRMADRKLPDNPFGAQDVGNIRYNKDDRFNYSLSGAETLMIDQGQCSSMSTLLHFMLRDDYEELKYIHLLAVDDGHIMICIKNDGLYYLINPVDYKKQRRPDGSLEKYIKRLWLEEFEDSNVVCSDSLEEMMVDLSKGDLAGRQITKIITIDYDGVFVSGDKDGKSPGIPGNYNVYPTGAKAEAWTPDSPIEYRDPKHNTSQLGIIGLADFINSR